MTFSRSSRITLLLCIDVVFFFVELIVGYAVGSLALISDSFHMLNDVMSLIVALYAIKLSGSSNTDSRYTYGWHRAEILAALINGVFLLALCFSIAMEALERFFSAPDISQPRLVVIVGCLGLASNIVGLFLFHEHGHSHGGHSHTHGAEPVQAQPEPVTPFLDTPDARRNSFGSTMYGHPVATRASIAQVANNIRARSPSPERHPAISEATEATVLLHDHDEDGAEHSHSHANDSHGHTASDAHAHTRTTPKAGSMNMESLILHVLGDALGNVGVIATGLIIWLTEWRFKYYCDPVISLFITAIIFSTALPLVRSTSLIMLQGVPSSIDAVEVKQAILNVDGVLALHELHIWQLSETKVIASVHVTTSKQHEFMPIAKTIRKVLHQHGIHSSTIQPEYQTNLNHSSDNLSQTSTDTCLVVCPIDAQCDPKENACCPPPSMDV